MKRAAFFYLLIFGLVLSGALTGCKQGPDKGITTIHGQRVAPPKGPGPGGVLSDGGTLGAGADPVDWGDPSLMQPRDSSLDEAIHDRDTFAAHTVYFDFDRFNVKASEGPKLEAVAGYLQTNATGDLLIEGHCDERGTDGYNFALGERRAQAVREYLENLGVNPNRLHTISHGRSRPAVDDRSEAAYAKNRRGELVLLLPAQ